MKIVLIITATFIGTLVNAQKTKFGIKAGYTISYIKADPTFGNALSYDSSPMNAFYFGGLAEHKFNESFGIQGELLYSPLGGIETYEYKFFEGKSSLTTAEIEFKTLQIPISAKYFLNNKFALNAGANFISILSATSTSYESFDIKDQTKFLSIAPFIGADYTFQNGIFFNATYHIGISDLSEYNRKLRNSFFQMGVGFKFGRATIDEI